MKQDRKREIISRIKSFPSMSGIAAKALKLLDDPDANAAQVEQLLKQDPGLTANLLKLTNSAYFGIPSKVGSVRHAVVMIGWKKVSKLVMAACVNAITNRQIVGYDLPPGVLWQHSVAVSVTAEGLMRELKIAESDEIFTAALLHDLGKLILGGFVEKELDEIEKVAARGIPFQMAEQEVLGTNHAEIGGLMLESWSFPTELVNAVRWHHDPDSAPQTGVMTDIVHVANVLCLMIGIGIGVEGLHYEPSVSATKRLGIKPTQLELIASQTLEWANELAGVFE
ncbi:MAG: HDOD domain-containing protein [Deltaproteobacteria bacterium]|nr:HDOD domain-containing protein [Deltaproteobacteria bacterium]MBW2354599.1 HDOD domain-containing protein [Deltaproteobacteria bacterium]HDZ23611.1 HDOD domain-containing protein [Desulfobacteraceae bacterium]